MAQDNGDHGLPQAVQALRTLTRTAELRPVKGRVVRAVGTVIHAVVPSARIGELCYLDDPRTGWRIPAEVVGLSEGEAVLTPIGDLHGLSSHAEVTPTGRMMDVQVGRELLGRVLDAHGSPIDGLGPLPPGPRRCLTGEAPAPLDRQLVSRQLPLGVRALDGLLACGEGQRFGLYGEPGGGKSSLLAQIVKGTNVDAAVVALIGERGREVREFVEHTLGAAGLARSVLIVSTSDRPAMERVKAAYTATTIAEHWRDEGQRVLLIMDSVTRFARALREIGLAAGEPPTRRGFPPSVFAALPRLMERAGPGASGSITAFYAVLVEGDGQGDPIAEETRGILDGHIVLSRTLAASNHYPAIDILTSRSRVMNNVASPEHRRAANRLRELLARYADVEFLVQVGEYKPGGDPVADEAIAKIEAIRAFLRQGGDDVQDLGETVEWMTRLVGSP